MERLILIVNREERWRFRLQLHTRFTIFSGKSHRAVAGVTINAIFTWCSISACVIDTVIDIWKKKKPSDVTKAKEVDNEKMTLCRRVLNNSNNQWTGDIITLRVKRSHHISYQYYPNDVHCKQNSTITIYWKSGWRCILHLRLPPLRFYVGWVSVDLNLTWGFFSGYSGFPPSPKSTPSQKHLAWVLCSGIVHDRLAAAWCAFHMHSADPVWAAPLAIQPSGLQVRVINRTLSW